MYARAGQFGVVALPDVDPVYSDPMNGPTDDSLHVVVDGDPTDPRIYLTPTVVNTGGGDPTPQLYVQPVNVDPTMIPQQLPDIVVTASPATAQAGVPVWVWLGLAALVAIGVGGGRKGGGTRSWM